VPVETLAIVNPLSVGGGAGRRWSRIESKLREALGAIEIERTRGPRDAERIAREAARAGVERLVIVGGDGTANEVVSGLLSAGLGDCVHVGVLPLGTGGDLARKLRVPRDMTAAIEALRRGTTRCIDAGRIGYRDPEGGERSSYFINVASLGLSGLVDQHLRRIPRHLGGRVSYMLGALLAVASYRCPHVRIRVDGVPVHDGPLVLAAAANGSYFGGGMQIAPEADCADGLLDFVIIGELSKPGLLANMPSIYRGTHVKHPAVSVHRGLRLEAEAEAGEETVWLDIDGDPLGTLPATVELLPNAITLFGAEPA
jgi:YegS/Rv2252/BmrU family lipid kinase